MRLRRLGSSESEALLYKGTVSVEGIHDVEVARAGFDDLFRRYILKDRGGRGPIEKAIVELQNAEKRGDEIGFHYFIFDRDRKPTLLTDSACVRLLQLKRFCLENYLIDIEIVTDISRDREFSDNPIKTTTDTRDMMKGLALVQLDEVVAREIFKSFDLESVGFDMSTLKRGVNEISKGLVTQIEKIEANFLKLRATDFVVEFDKRFNLSRGALLALWDDRWWELCDGKRLFDDMRRKGMIKGDILKVKRKIISEMRNRTTETYDALTATFKGLLNAN